MDTLPRKKPTKKEKAKWPPGDAKGLPRPGDVAEMILDGRWAALKASWLDDDDETE